MSTLRFSLPTVVCGACSATIEKAIQDYNDYVAKPHLPFKKSLLGLKKIAFKRIQIDTVSRVLSLEVEDPNVAYDDVLSVLTHVLEEVGHECERLSVASKKLKKKRLSSTSRYSHGLQGGIGVLLGFALLSLSFLPITIPFLGMLVIVVASVVTTLILGAEFYVRAKKQLQAREPAMDVLFAISSLAAISLTVASLFIPGLPMMCEAGLLIFGFRHIGLAIRDSLSSMFRRQVKYASMVPQSVLVLDKNNRHVTVPLRDIKPGDLLVIFPGEILPTDGVCCLTDDPTKKTNNSEGRLFSTANIDGATYPRNVRHQHAVLAGMKLLPNEKSMLLKVTGKSGYRLNICYQQAPRVTEIENDVIYLYIHNKTLCYCAKDKAQKVHYFTIDDAALTDDSGAKHARGIRDVLLDKKKQKTLSTLQFRQVFAVSSQQGFQPIELDSYLQRLDQDIDAIEVSKPVIVQYTETVLRWFVPIIVIAAVFSGMLISQFFPLIVALKCSLSVLVAACPCTFGLNVPLAFKIGVNKANRRGVRINRSQLLEDLCEIEHVIFDLHGTLTTGQLSVDEQRWKILEAGLSLVDFKRYVAALEEDATHPIGQVIYNWSNKEPHKLTVTHRDNSHHAGLIGVIDKQQYIVGNENMMMTHGIDVDAMMKTISLKAGDTITFIAREKTILGYLIVKDPLREDAAQTIKLLQNGSHGKSALRTCRIITGSDRQTALRYARELGIHEKNVHACCTAADKESLVQGSVRNTTLMVGDAANDSLAMKACRASIAIKHQSGDEITQKNASAVIEGGRLSGLISLFDISQATMENIKQNLGFSLAYNLVSVIVAGGLLLAWNLSVSPGVYAALMIVQTCLILLNVYRFYKKDFSLSSTSSRKESDAADEQSRSYRHILSHAPKVSMHKRKVDPPRLPHPLFQRTTSIKKNREESRLEHGPGASLV